MDQVVNLVVSLILLSALVSAFFMLALRADYAPETVERAELVSADPLSLPMRAELVLTVRGSAGLRLLLCSSRRVWRPQGLGRCPEVSKLKRRRTRTRLVYSINRDDIILQED